MLALRCAQVASPLPCFSWFSDAGTIYKVKKWHFICINISLMASFSVKKFNEK